MKDDFGRECCEVKYNVDIVRWTDGGEPTSFVNSLNLLLRKWTNTCLIHFCLPFVLQSSEEAGF